MKNYKKIFELIRKTGDRYIFEDDDGNIFVAMAIADYENLTVKESGVRDLTEEELLNRINKDVAVWKSSQEDKNILENWPKNEGEAQEDRYYFETNEEDD